MVWGWYTSRSYKFIIILQHIFFNLTGQTCEITFDKDVLVDKGQSIVVYGEDICLGGGVVE